jgi:hypothetical protein
MEDSNPYKDDVAFSFLNGDIGIAQQIKDGLGNARVFLYADRQQEIAGTDGQEKFRTAFRFDARMVVVLYRSGWGATPFTRIEQQAIQDRCMQSGWDFLLFVMLDGSVPPRWLPENRMRFNFEEYGLSGAIGAIKFRLQELGAVVKEESLVERAARIARIADFEAESRRLYDSEQGVEQATGAASEYLEMVAELAATQLRESFPRLRIGKNLAEVAFTTGRASFSTCWESSSNKLYHAFITIGIYRQRIDLPGDPRTFRNPPSPGCPRDRLVLEINRRRTYEKFRGTL